MDFFGLSQESYTQDISEKETLADNKKPTDRIYSIYTKVKNEN